MQAQLQRQQVPSSAPGAPVYSQHQQQLPQQAVQYAPQPTGYQQPPQYQQQYQQHQQQQYVPPAGSSYQQALGQPPPAVNYQSQTASQGDQSRKRPAEAHEVCSPMQLPFALPDVVFVTLCVHVPNIVLLCVDVLNPCCTSWTASC